MLRELRPSLTLLILLMALTGLAYPLLTLGAGQILFPHQAHGSLIEENGKLIGSSLIGQNFTNNGYFHPRPSSAGEGYDAARSAGSNAAVASAAYLKTVTERVEKLKQEKNIARIPVDLVTASGSGLDPDISSDAALFQLPRIAEARHLTPPQIEDLIKSSTTPPQWGFMGPARVNVLELNRGLDRISAPSSFSPPPASSQ